MKKIAVIGGGFVGSRVAKNLEPLFTLTLIDTKDYFEFTPAILKTISNPNHLKKIQIKHKDYLSKTKIIKGKVKKITNKFILVNGKKIFFDYLVIASGSAYSSPIKDQNISIISKAHHIKDLHNKIENINHIAIAGGGAVAVELAAELSLFYPKKKIEIFTSSKKLLPRNNKITSLLAEEFLLKNKVKINFNSKIEKKGKDFFCKNKKLNCDHLFLATGIKNNYEFIKPGFNKILNKRNQVIVNDFLQVKDNKNIFSGGDITDINEEKTAQSANVHANIITKNILNLEKNKSLKKYFSKKRPYVLSLGNKYGIIEYKNLSFAGLIPGLLKHLIEKKALLFYKI